ECVSKVYVYGFFFQAEDSIRDRNVTGVQTCALPIFDDTVARKEPVTPREAFSFQPVSTVNLSDWSTSVSGRACSLANREVRIGYVHLVHCNTTKRYASVGNQVSTHVAEVCYTAGITTYRVTAIVLNTMELNISLFHTDVSHGGIKRMSYEGQAICCQAVNLREGFKGVI